jgi:soluble lytic murein transglycosylase-like protein
LFSRVPASERGPGAPEAGVSERWLAFERAATAIVGFDHATAVPAAGFEEFVTAIGTNHPAVIACDARMIARDRLAYRLAMVGYSTRDVAIILLGEASPAQVDADYARGLAGLPRSRRMETAIPTDVALLPQPALPSEPVSVEGIAWAPTVMRPGSLQTPSASAPLPELASGRLASHSLAHALSMSPVSLRRAPALLAPAPRVGFDEVDAQIRRYADAYKVDYRLVAAMIRQESNWQQVSVSSKGAVGLMQLMPATAAMLNVNAHDPVDNIRGGIAYLAGLLHTYGDLRCALIAYNAGPTHANQVIRGERGLFAETRRYLDAIAAMYPLD